MIQHFVASPCSAVSPSHIFFVCLFVLFFAVSFFFPEILRSIEVKGKIGQMFSVFSVDNYVVRSSEPKIGKKNFRYNMCTMVDLKGNLLRTIYEF